MPKLSLGPLTQALWNISNILLSNIKRCSGCEISAVLNMEQHSISGGYCEMEKKNKKNADMFNWDISTCNVFFTCMVCEWKNIVARFFCLFVFAFVAFSTQTPSSSLLLNRKKKRKEKNVLKTGSAIKKARVIAARQRW